MYTQLNINNYCSEFILGNNPEEKLKKRAVIINISLRFAGTDSSRVITDNLQDTVCYDDLLRFLDSKLKDAEFNLIEKATSFIFESLEEYFAKIKILKGSEPPKEVKILKRVEVIKPEPFGDRSAIANNTNQDAITNTAKLAINPKNTNSVYEGSSRYLESASFVISEWY